MVIILAGLLIAFQLMTDGIFWRPLNITNLVLQNSHISTSCRDVISCALRSCGFVGRVSDGVCWCNCGHDDGQSPNEPVDDSYRMSCSRRADRRMARFWVAYAGIPAFIVTLAGLLMFRGLTQVVLGGQSLAPFQLFSKMSTGYLPDLSEGSSLHFLTLILGMIITIVLVVGQWRTRNRRKIIYLKWNLQQLSW